MRISDWSSDVCSSDLAVVMLAIIAAVGAAINAILAAQPAFAIAAVVAIMAIGVVIALGGLVVITGAVTTVIAVAFRAGAERQQRYRAERDPNRLHGINRKSVV